MDCDWLVAWLSVGFTLIAEDTAILELVKKLKS
jgi:hypothetical protein